MSNKSKQFVSFFMFISVLLITIYIVFKDQSLSAIIEATKMVKPTYIIFGVFMIFIFIACDALKLTIILKGFNHSISIFKTLGYAFIGFYFSAITPSATGGQPAQIYYMSKDNIQLSYSSLTLLITTIIYQMTTIGYAGVLFFMNSSFVMEHLGNLKYLLLLSVVVNTFMILMMLMLMFSKSLVKKIFLGSIRILYRLKLLKNFEKSQRKLDRVVTEYTKGAAYIKTQPLLVLKIIIVTIIQMTAMYLIPFFVYKAFNLSLATAVQMITLQALLSLAVSSLPLPGSMGASENGFLLLFKIFFATNLLIPAMLLSRIISFYGIFIISGIITVILSWLAHRKTKIPTSYKLEKIK